MTAYAYLTVGSVIAINGVVGGPGSGVLDRGGLEAAVHRPRSEMFGVEFFDGVWAKAAAYLHGLSATQYFSDGNKRTAWIAASTFLAINGYRLPPMPDTDSESLIRSVAADLFASDADRERTVVVAADWLRSRWEQRHRPGPVVDPRLEFVQLCRYAQVDISSGMFDVVEGGAGALFATYGFPFPADLTLVGRIHWRRDDIGFRHRVGYKVTPIDNPTLKRVNRASDEGMLDEVLIESDRWHHQFGVLPTVFVQQLGPVFLGAGEFVLTVTIDGERAAELPLTVMEVTSVPDGMSE